MEVSSSHQMYVFFLCVVAGIGCGVFFDLQRSLRRLRFAGGFRTTVEDIVFVFATLGGIIALGYFFNSGQMRYYQVMGTVSGSLFYAAFLSRSVMKALGFIYSVIEKIIVKPLKKIFGGVFFAIKRLWFLIKGVFLKIKRLAKRIGRCIYKRKKRLKKRIKML